MDNMEMKATSAQNPTDEELVAVIMGAIQAVMGESGYRVVSIRPATNAALSTWKLAIK